MLGPSLAFRCRLILFVALLGLRISSLNAAHVLSGGVLVASGLVLVLLVVAWMLVLFVQ